MPNVEDFIVRFMKSRKLSYAKLASRLGYKSQTSILRIAGGQSNEKSVAEFAARLRREFALSDLESRDLISAVAILKLGQEGYDAEVEMWNFLRGPSLEEHSPALIDSADSSPPQSLFLRCSPFERVELTVLNCQYVNIFDDLALLIRERRAKVSQYFLCDRNTARTIRAINASMGVIYEKNYEGFVLDDDGTREVSRVQGMARADVMLCSFETREGSKRFEMITFDSPSHGVSIAVSEADARSPFLFPRSDYRPVKRKWADCGFSDYIQYSTDYSRLEFNRSILKIKPDIGIDYISSDILLNAFMDNREDVDADESNTVSILAGIYKSRFEDTFSKRKHVHTILKKNAMRLFSQTGRTTDHFWAMRPFTPAERISIIRNLTDQQRLNPYFHLYFLADDDSIRDVEIACYDETGILVQECEASYDLANGHSEVMITHPEFMRIFEKFMLETLIKQYVLPPEDTVTILEELISRCKEML